MDTRLYAVSGVLIATIVILGVAVAGVPGFVLGSGPDEGPANGNQGADDVNAISFVGFCTEAPADFVSGSVTSVDYKEGDTSEPIEVTWSSNPAVDYITYKAGEDVYVIEYDPAATNGEFEVGDGVPAAEFDPMISSSNFCGDGQELAKFEWDGDNFEREVE